MLKGIDHIVIVVRDLEQAAKDYEKLGFTVVPGGKHPVGSHNALISFADGSYIEILSFYRTSPAHRWWAPLQVGEGLVDFCMQTDDLAGDTAKFRNAGVKINDPVPWSRVRPDGYELKWVLSLAQQECRGVAPFLIQDLTPREERVPQKFDHRNGTKGIGAVTVAVNDFDRVRRWYQGVLGTGGTEVGRADLDATGVRFRVGPHQFDFVRPQSKNSPLSEQLRKRGSSPYAATLLTSLEQPPSLDSPLTHGAILLFA